MDTSTRFWIKVRVGTKNECWIWMRGCDHGYGSFRLNGRSVRAHRLAWELVNGPIPDGKHVLHHCDTPRCCNPAHLYIGTDVENARDRVERGRAKGGYAGRVPRKPGWNRKVREDDRRGGVRKLLPWQVEEIRALHATNVSMRALAATYGVTHPTISQVVRGEGVYKGE